MIPSAKRLTDLPVLVRLDSGHDALHTRIGLSVEETQQRDGKTYRFRRVMQITERRSTASGQMLLLTDIDIEGWWTSLDSMQYNDVQIIALYRDHC